MTSYFEKLTSINTSSLNLVGAKFQGSGASSVSENLVEKIEELKQLNTKLELDLKCEHDEKSDLVSLKVGLESEILELREINERLEFQVEQLKDEKDKIHHVLAKIREDIDKDRGLFIATSSMSSAGIMKKFPSLDDLSRPSSPTDSNRATTCVSPTSTTSCGPLERIDEIDETLLESLVMAKDPEGAQQQPNSAHTLDQLVKRIAFLESENELLRKPEYCASCKKRSSSSAVAQPAMIFEHDDEGLVLSAVDEADDAGFVCELEKDEEQIKSIVEMQRKIIEKLEREVFRLDDRDRGRDVRHELTRMKEELERKMNRIVQRVAGGAGAGGSVVLRGIESDDVAGAGGGGE